MSLLLTVDIEWSLRSCSWIGIKSCLPSNEHTTAAALAPVCVLAFLLCCRILHFGRIDHTVFRISHLPSDWLRYTETKVSLLREMIALALKTARNEAGLVNVSLRSLSCK